jgi:hypothetical protein
MIASPDWPVSVQDESPSWRRPAGFANEATISLPTRSVVPFE